MFAPRWRTALATLTILALGACGSDDDLVGPGDSQLSQAQSMEMFNVFMTISNEALAGVTASRGLPEGISAAAAVGSFEHTGSCPLGGNVSFKGSYTDEVDDNGTGSFAFDLTETPTGCKANSSYGAVTFDGDPNLHVSYRVDVKNENPTTFRWTMKGALRFSGGVTGTCATDMDYSLNYQTQKFTMNGTMCGHQVSYQG